ncbi:hypothetical protein F5Y03DRAFT_210129 [Xylaria venustula]|nr:hypothetical protein F5Y03DRAFT_210129 [Xylaria venustula]
MDVLNKVVYCSISIILSCEFRDMRARSHTHCTWYTTRATFLCHNDYFIRCNVRCSHNSALTLPQKIINCRYPSQHRYFTRETFRFLFLLLIIDTVPPGSCILSIGQKAVHIPTSSTHRTIIPTESTVVYMSSIMNFTLSTVTGNK